MADKTIKGYRILQQIGKGGMAAIYLAENIATSEKVALKILLPHIANDRDYVLRFLHEVRANKKLDHDNIVKIIDCDEVKGKYFMAMEFVDGLTLQNLLRQVPILPRRCSLYLLRQMLEGLSFSHGKGIIHRDMKPSNILLGKDGSVKISDFGISKTTEFTNLTQTGSVLGTPAYMSPEQARGKAVDNRSDIFSTGIIFYEAILGFNPFFSDNPSTAILNILQKTPPSPSDLNPTISADLEVLIERMIAKEREDRFGSVDEILEVIQQYEISEGRIIDREEFRTFMANPESNAVEINRMDAALIVELARGLVNKGQEFYNQAIWEYYKALHLVPDDPEILKELNQLCGTMKYNLTARKSPKIIQLEESLEQNPASMPVLMQLAKLHRIEGNFLEVIHYYKRLRKLKPVDGYLQNQIESLVGDRTLARQITAAHWSGQEAATASRYVTSHATMPRIDLVQVKPLEPRSNGRLYLAGGGAMILAIVLIFLGWRSFTQPLRGEGDQTVQVIMPGIRTIDPIDNPLLEGELDNIPSAASALYKEADLSLERKDYARAKQLFSLFSGRYPDVNRTQVLFKRAIAEKNLGNYDAALALTDQLLSLNPVPTIALLTRQERARIYSLRDDAAAEAEYHDAVDRLEQVPEKQLAVSCLVDYANFMRHRGQTDQALEIADRILKRYDAIEFQNTAHLVKAAIYVDAQQPKFALKEYSIALKNLSPEQTEYAQTQAKADQLRRQLGMKPGETVDEGLEVLPQEHRLPGEER